MIAAVAIGAWWSARPRRVDLPDLSSDLAGLVATTEPLDAPAVPAPVPGQDTANTGELLFSGKQTDPSKKALPLTEQDTDPGRPRALDVPGVHVGGGAAFNMYADVHGFFESSGVDLAPMDPPQPSPLDQTLP